MANNILIQEIEAVEENYQSTFRSIYQTDSEKLETVCESHANLLEKRIVQHDREIERICRDYQGFLDSIRELLQVRAQTNNLNSEVVSLNEALNEANQGLIRKGYELLEARKVESNIASTIETLSLCMPVLDCYSKLLKQVSEKRYYPALKTLEILENEHLPKVSNYRFATAITENIPRLKKEIKSLDDFCEFLERVRDYLANIGERALRHTKESQKRSLKSVIEEHKSKIEEIDNDEIDDDDICAQDMIDFSPIYRCFHIYTVLNDKEYFAKYYQKQRKDQAKLVLQAPQAMHDNLEAYKKYIYSFVGFFVVEDHVMNTTGGEIVTRSYLEELWNISLAKCINVLSMSSSSCTDPNILLRIKNLIMLSITTLKYHGYTVTQLFDFLLELRDHYNEVLLQRWVIEFRDILSNCDFLPLETNTVEEYDSVLERFPFHSDQLEQEDFPKRFPFSRMVPEVYQQAMEFMYACMKFSEELTLSPNEVATMVRKAANLLLTRSFSGCLSLVFKSPSSSLALQQVIQIIVDTQYLEKAGPFLDEFVCKMTSTQNQQAPSMAMFQVTIIDILLLFFT
jgi:exocyst complex component 6